jgi:hypothetical protein
MKCPSSKPVVAGSNPAGRVWFRLALQASLQFYDCLKNQRNRLSEA